MKDFQSLIGKTAALAYRHVLLSHPIETVTVFNYQSPPKLQQRVSLDHEDNAIIEKALALRSNAHIPFWDAVLNVSLAVGRLSDALLSAAFFHNGQGQATNYRRDAVEAGVLEQLTTGNQLNVALGSKVTITDGTEAHFGLLDFHCDISDANTVIVHRICRALMPQGFLVLNSGDSYHACSANLLSHDERVSMLGKALLATPVVDAQYIAHQLQQDSSSIRISRGGKAKQFPTVVEVWAPNKPRS